MTIDIDSCIRSYVPGRVRIRHASLKGLGADEVRALKEMIEGVEGVRAADINPRTASLLLYWDETQLSADDLKAWFAWYVESCAAQPEGAQQTQQSCGGGETCGLPAVREACQKAGDEFARLLAPGIPNIKRARRTAQNRAMLGLGAASVAALAAGRRLHAWLGFGFVLLSLVHLYQHRRVL